jgi:heavy metal translocating P-type ATPase
MLLAFGVNLAPPDEPSLTRLLQLLVLGSTLIVVALLGGPLLRNTLHEWRQRRVTVESLFVLTLLGAMIASLQSFVRGTGPIYFETVSILLIVYTIGKLIGAHGRAEALAKSKAWTTELARCRLVDERGRTREVETAAILPGDLVEVRPGEAIAIDGVIERGTGYVCVASRTGEPFPVVHRPGDRVLAGCVSEDALFVVRATAAGTARQVDSFLQAIDDARSSPSSLQRQADRLAAVFLPVVTTVALLTFVFWTWQGGWQDGLFHAMSVLLVACPCALGLATPIVLWATLGRLAGRGLITRQGDLVERLAAVDRVLFDKTGTLTEERFVLADLVVDETRIERARLLRCLAAVEARSSHPVARGFADLVSAAERDRVEVRSLHVVAGCGIEAIVEDDGEHTLRIGRPDWLECSQLASRDDRQLAERVDHTPLLSRLIHKDGHRVDVELDGQFVAVAMLSERLRGSARETLDDLTRLGLPVEVLTGDTLQHATATLGTLAPIQSLSPEEKRQRIEDLYAKELHTLFIGDGLNDAAALSSATVGIALSSGTDLAVGASSVTLYGGDLRVLPWAVALCRRAVALTRSTMLWAVGYNLVGMTLAAAGLLHPIAAALLMTVSSLWIAWLSSRAAVVPATCHDTATPTVPVSRTVAGAHALALVAQGLLVVFLLDLSPSQMGRVLPFFLTAGLGIACLLRFCPRIPHALATLLPMLTFGNLGMLAGLWLDEGFAPLREGCSCGCGSLPGAITAHPAMWFGMLLLCTVAARYLSVVPCPVGSLVFCSSCMVLGMSAGGHVATWFIDAKGWQGQTIHLLCMSLGMLAGHLTGAITSQRWCPRVPAPSSTS